MTLTILIVSLLQLTLLSGREIEMAERYLRIKDVVSRVGLSRATIYRKVKASTFPSPYVLSDNCVGWKDSELEVWCSTREQRSAAEIEEFHAKLGLRKAS